MGMMGMLGMYFLRCIETMYLEIQMEREKMKMKKKI